LPFGPARNGAIVYAEDGDLFIADELGGTPRPLVSGPDVDSDPVFSRQGGRIAFVREAPDESRRIMTVSPDGSDVRELAMPGVVKRLDWSPDGSALLASTFSLEDLSGLKVIQSDGSGSRTLDLQDFYPQSGSWRPDGRHIAFVGNPRRYTAFIADADGTNIRNLPVGVGGVKRGAGLEWSPDGKHLSFLSSGADRGTVISIADIDEHGAMSDVRQLDPDPASALETDPTWSPDGSQLAFALWTSSALRAGIANADGSSFRLVGPEVSVHRAIDLTWAPDGRSLVIFEHQIDVPDVPVGPSANVWSVDVATGEQTEVKTPVSSWQRLAP